MSEPQDPRKLAQDALELASKAVKGPWESFGESITTESVESYDHTLFGICQVSAEPGYEFMDEGNINFIAQSRQLIPDLATALLEALDFVENYRRERKWLLAIIDKYEADEEGLRDRISELEKK